MRISVDFGHGTTGDRGAQGYLNEEKIIREYGTLVIDKLKILGHTVINVTPSKQNLTLAQSLAYRVNMANNFKADLFVSLHVNSFKWDKARGCEVEYISLKGKNYADKICNEISSLGFINRGSIKRENLYILKYTTMPAILIEPFFCDNKSDCELYNSIKLSNAIIKGITGKQISEDTMYINNSINSNIPNIDYSIPTKRNIYDIPGGLGYIEVIKESGRIDIHLDRYNYLSIQDSEKYGNRIFVNTRTKGTKIIL